MEEMLIEQSKAPFMRAQQPQVQQTLPTNTLGWNTPQQAGSDSRQRLISLEAKVDQLTVMQGEIVKALQYLIDRGGCASQQDARGHDFLQQQGYWICTRCHRQIAG